MPKAPSFISPLAASDAAALSLRNCRTDAVLARQLEAALTRDARRRGLLGRDSMVPDTGLVIAPCRAIHTFFMRFAIDVLFVSRTGEVISLRTAVPAGRIAVAWRAFGVIELPAGTIDRTGTRRGDMLQIVHGP